MDFAHEKGVEGICCAAQKGEPRQHVARSYGWHALGKFRKASKSLGQCHSRERYESGVFA